MNSSAAETVKPNTLVGDALGGLAAMLVALPSSIAFGVIVYTTMGPEHAGEGAMAGLLGATALGLVTPLFGRTDGLISAPCAPAAAVLSTLVASLLATQPAGAGGAAMVLPLVALTALLAAALQFLYGAIGGGRLIKFIPYPVVCGYLSGVGVLIALGQLPKLFGIPKGTSLWHGIATPELWRWQGLVVGIVTMIVMLTAQQVTRKVPAAILGLMGGVGSYFLLAAFNPALLQVQGNPLVIGPIITGGSLLETISGRARSLFSMDISAIRLILVPALTLSVLLSIDTLKTCVGLDALTHNRHNSDRELRGQGLGNLTSFLLGGLPGAGTMGPTLVNVSSGGKTYRSALFAGAFVIMALLFLNRLIAWVPIGALAGILLVIAWRMFDRNMFHLLRYPSGRQDFAVIAGVILVAVADDLITAAGVGVAMAILLFIRDQIKGSVIHRKRYLNQMSSKTHRLPPEREVLNQRGERGVVCELQGNLFFGTTDQLYSQLEPDLRKAGYVLLDLRRVRSMDYTAAHLFEQMHRQLAARGGQLLLSGMPSAVDQRNFQHYLTQLGVVKEDGGVMVSETLDAALEWMEERILAEAGIDSRREERLLAVHELDLFRDFEGPLLEKLAACLREVTVPAGEAVFRQGEQGDEIFFVRRGSVRILLPLEGGKRHHLATIGQGDFFGELSFLDQGIRSAMVEAKTATDLYALSRSRFQEQAREDADYGVTIFTRLALAITDRLRQTNTELQVLEER